MRFKIDNGKLYFLTGIGVLQFTLSANCLGGLVGYSESGLVFVFFSPRMLRDLFLIGEFWIAL